MHLFFQSDIHANKLSDEEANHCIKVMRMQVGDQFKITDGKGSLASATITQLKKQEVIYSLHDLTKFEQRNYQIKMYIAPTRKIERNEWMVEKMVELGVDEIHFFDSTHTHSDSFKRVTNLDRMHRIAVAAMKQSFQTFLPTIHLHNSTEEMLASIQEGDKYIAYVTELRDSPHLSSLIRQSSISNILIGPEGDFSENEIELALVNQFQPVSLGKTRLRTETAAIIACHCVHLGDSLSSRS